MVSIWKGWATNSALSRTVKDYWSKNAIHEVNFGRDILEMVLKTLTLKESEDTIDLVDSQLKGFP